MGAMVIYRLAPQAAFHFGLRGVGVEETATYCPADTLFSALCLTLREWEAGGSRALEAWLARFPPLNGGQPPPLRLSSAFPYAGDVLFFPKPLLPASLPPETARDRAKTLKKIEYVSRGILEAWLAGADLGALLHDDLLLQDRRVWVTGDERRALAGFYRRSTDDYRMWSRVTLPRVAVDRQTSRSAVYQAGGVRFGEGAGLYTLVEFLDGDAEAEQRRLARLFEVMGHGGLGGERSSGYGRFEMQGPAPFTPLAGGSGLLVTLSPYHPTRDEVQAGVLGGEAAYSLHTRRGWVGSPDGLYLRRRSVRLLGEGSVVPDVGRGSYGDLADVTPPGTTLSHKVWRYGLAFPVPANPPAPRQEVDHG